MKILDWIVLAILACATSFALGVHEGRRMVTESSSQERKAHFIKSVYEQNDKWCNKHKRYC